MRCWLQLIIKMRWILVAAVVAFSSVEIYASDTKTDESLSVIDASEAAPGVIVSAIPAPVPVIEILKLDDPIARARSAKKQRLAKKKPSPTMMLTRTERRQVALLVSATKTSGSPGQLYNQDDDFQSGLDELVFHRSYNRPKLVTDSYDVEDEADELSAHVRLRLLMARLRAVEAHALNQVPDNGEALPESVRRRLEEARMKAVQAHQKKFS